MTKITNLQSLSKNLHKKVKIVTVRYNVFHWFRQAKSAYGRSIQKIKLASKVVKNDSK